MGLFDSIKSFIGRAVHFLIPYKRIEAAVEVETSMTSEMENQLTTWYEMYTGHASWLSDPKITSLGLPAFICSEIARQVVLEMEANISAPSKDGNPARSDDGKLIHNEMSRVLSEEFKKCLAPIREKLEIAMAAGGMIIKPYVLNGKIFFDFVPDWNILPIAFDGAGNLEDVYFRDLYVLGKKRYTRLERHTVIGNDVRIQHRVFVSEAADQLGTECSLSAVPKWKDLAKEAIVKDTGGKQLFGWYRAALANQVEPDNPLGVSVFSRAVDLIRDADFQYSNLMWEFEGSQLAIDVDPSALRLHNANTNGQKVYCTPQLNERLFRQVDLGHDETYKVFSPQIREGSIMNGLNEILSRIEDSTGLARGTMSNTTTEALTATQLRILRQRTYTTVRDNQKALEACLRDVVDAMAVYVNLYLGIKSDKYEVSFAWDDSILVDAIQESNERIAMVNMGAYSKAEYRQWKLGETQKQAEAAIAKVMQETMDSLISSQVANAALGNPDMPDGVADVVEETTNRVDDAEANANRALE